MFMCVETLDDFHVLLSIFNSIIVIFFSDKVKGMLYLPKNLLRRAISYIRFPCKMFQKIRGKSSTEYYLELKHSVGLISEIHSSTDYNLFVEVSICMKRF